MSYRDRGGNNREKDRRRFLPACRFKLFLLSGVAPSYGGIAVWISGNGSPANDCVTVATPCREFATALTKAGAGGTIHVLSGQYLSFAITTAIQIVADGGTSSIVQVGGSAAITVQAGAGDVVSIRGMNINQSGFGGGITFISGAALHLDDCTIIRTTVNPGLNIVPSSAASGGVPTEITVRHSVIRGNGLGNVLIKPTNGIAVAALLEDALMAEGIYGIRADNSDGSGTIRVDIKNSAAKGNSNNGFLAVGSGVNPIHFMIDRSIAENNGVYGAVATGAQAFTIVTNSTLMGNGTGLAQLSGATVGSTGHHQLQHHQHQRDDHACCAEVSCFVLRQFSARQMLKLPHRRL